MDSQDGLVWEPSWFGESTPTWTKEPDLHILHKIARRALNLTTDAPCVVEALDQGTFNKVYTVQCGNSASYIFRVSLPVHPRFQTMSEQATIQYVRHHTDIPAPKVFNYETSNKNELSFEWIIMERVNGRQLGTFQDQFLNVSWLKKEVIVRKVVFYLAQLFQKRFRGLGNLFTTADLQGLQSADMPDTMLLGSDFSADATGFCLSEIVSIPFFSDKHLQANTMILNLLATTPPRHANPGPNASSPYFPNSSPSNEQEAFVLHHHDLNSSNILIGAEHNLTGIINWKCITTLPLWLACDNPKFLIDQPRTAPPNSDEWPITFQDNSTQDRNDMYHEHLEGYEKMALRRLYLEEMGRKRKKDFEEAVTFLGVEMMASLIERWIEVVEKGDEPRGINDRPRSYEYDEEEDEDEDDEDDDEEEEGEDDKEDEDKKKEP
ncbi:hypothetical protein EK21DRAFT_107656 [Setomelanomma holmii]|uniref:Aminoglycoside phosphotransferase domain-containing protein n=1 Tax=Setomelanomma holmii TaxID=210430 RepID=A0A9P4LSR1_9PLEO|nr:hypothetical protein EK21DRAFT_107656 [Setomelanomma holmii]